MAEAPTQQDLSSILATLLALWQAISKPKPPVIPPVIPKPPDGGIGDPDFPDDIFPKPPVKPPVTARTVKRVVLKLSRVQLSRARFPEAYTLQNPFGLVPPKSIETGEDAMPYQSKFWLDLTAYDQDNREFLKDAIEANDLAFVTEHHCGEAYIIGHGANPDGSPKDGYETNDTDEIGNGITAWNTTNGFLHQMKAWGEGEFECWGKVGGVESNRFTIRVS